MALMRRPVDVGCLFSVVTHLLRRKIVHICAAVSSPLTCRHIDFCFLAVKAQSSVKYRHCLGVMVATQQLISLTDLPNK